MFTIHNFTDNDDIRIVEEKGPFQVLEYKRDLSVRREEAMEAYFASQMNVRKRQVYCDLSKGDVTVQPGAMQWMLGDVKATTGIKGAKDFFGKAVKGGLSGESAIKPEYTGTGRLCLEPTDVYILLEDLADWNGAIILKDGLFMACDGKLEQKIVARTNVSSAFGGMGLFNLSLKGEGVVCLESPVPREELIVIDLVDDVLKIDGNLALAWSNSLEFTVERSGKSLVGSAASGEGLVNAYRGTGRVIMAPVKDVRRQLQDAVKND